MENVSELLKKQGKVPNMTLLNEIDCDCGEKVKVYEMEITIGPRKGELFEAKMGCKCEDLALARKAMDNKKRALAREKAKKLQAVFDRHSLINRKLQQANFANYKVKNQTQHKAKQETMRFAKEFDKDNPENLLLFGTYGVGKSHLAKSVTDIVMEKGYSAIFISIPKLNSRFRSSYKKDSDYSEAELAQVLIDVDLLVLDDLGVGKDTDWSSEKLFEIIDSRQGLHTIFTSNFDPDALFQKLGERNFSRVVNEDSTILKLEGENDRLKKFARGSRNAER